MDLINTLLSTVVGMLSYIMPVLNLPEEFITKLDSGLALVITLIQGAGYFLPLDVMTLCFATVLVVDNFALMARVGQWVIRTVRG